MLLFSKEVVNTLLKEAHQELTRVEDALLALHDKGYSMCSEEFVSLMNYRRELKDSIDDLEKKFKRLGLIEEILKK